MPLWFIPYLFYIDYKRQVLTTKSFSMTASWKHKSTATRANCVGYEKHEVKSRRSRDTNARPSDP